MEVLQKKLTYKEFREMEFDDNDPFEYELINGELVQKQSPTFDHQLISTNIEELLREYGKKTNSGIMLHAPLDVVLDNGNAYHPDVFFIKKDRYHIFDKVERIIMGAPDLVVEILSKGTGIYDKGIKKDIYEMYGVREYWLVDPSNKSIEIYAFDNQRFKLKQYAIENGVLKSIILEGLEFNVEDIFQADFLA
ncbi:MAG: Uma2 family endonuclease [Bacteroidota bacterium]|mgnify:CR=1 FL=1